MHGKDHTTNDILKSIVKIGLTGVVKEARAPKPGASVALPKKKKGRAKRPHGKALLRTSLLALEKILQGLPNAPVSSQQYNLVLKALMIVNDDKNVTPLREAEHLQLVKKLGRVVSVHRRRGRLSNPSKKASIAKSPWTLVVKAYAMDNDVSLSDAMSSVRPIYHKLKERAMVIAKKQNKDDWAQAIPTAMKTLDDRHKIKSMVSLVAKHLDIKE